MGCGIIQNMKKKVVKKEQKYLTEKKFQVFEKTFEQYMGSITRSFSKMDERFDRHDKAFSLILKNMQVFTEEAREHRQSMSILMRTDVSQERDIENLKTRVDRLEMQVK